MAVDRSTDPDARVLLLAPTSRDGEATRAVLLAQGIECYQCSDLDHVCREYVEGASVIALPEEAVLTGSIDRLVDVLRRQPVWSDVPVIVLSRTGVESPAVTRALSLLGNVSLVERPVRVTTLLSVVRAAIRARQRQYEVRDQLVALRDTTERLDRQTRLFDNVASSTLDFIYTFDLEGKLLFANRRLLEVWALTLEHAVGKGLSELGYPDWHVEKHHREFAEVIATRKAVTGEVTFTGGSGTFGIYEYIFTPVFGPDGAVESIAGTTRDVTVRKINEERDSFLVRLDDATRGLTDPETVSQAMARLLGEHLGADRCAYADVGDDQDTFNLIGDYCRDGIASIVGRYRYSTDFGEKPHALMLAGEPYVVDDVETTPLAAGHLDAYRAAQIRSVISVPLLKDGRFVAGIGVHQATPRHWRRDEIELATIVAARCWESIERARVARSLAESEHRMRLAVETGRLGVWELDLRTREMTCSDMCKQHYGRGPDERFTYDELWASMYPDDLERVRTALQRALARGTDYLVEHRVVFPDSETRWVLVRARATYTGGVAARMIGVSVDITDRKTEEERRSRLLEAEQTARQAAERASQLKDEFLATLSHELRTPLSAILGWSQILRRANQRPEALAEGLATIERNARAQTQIIEDLLDMSRIMSGKVSLDARPIDLAAVVSAAVETVRPTSVAKDVTVAFTEAGMPMMIQGDPNRLQQVFWNLLSNAVKFTPQGGRVEVRAAQDGTRWRVDVIDTGEGIAGDFLPHVFDRFRQADASTTRRHGGLGLGLAIVKQLAELHGGTVAACSDGVGRGTTMSVWIPELRENSFKRAGSSGSGATGNGDHHEAPAIDDAWRRESCFSMAGIRAVIVDDEPDALALLRRVLEECDITVYAAPNADEALSLVATERPDVLVSDVGMPGEDGHSLIRRVRSLAADGGGTTPAVALTAYARTEDREKAIRAGFNVHVAKPVEPSELIDTVAALVGRKARSK